MLNDTQQDLLDSYIQDFFIRSADAMINSSPEADEQMKATTYIKQALTQSIVDFCRMVMAAYPRNSTGNNKKLLMLITLNSIINAEAPEVKFVKTVCDDRLSTTPKGMDKSEWRLLQQKLIAEQTKVKMLEWIETKQINVTVPPAPVDDFSSTI